MAALLSGSPEGSCPAGPGLGRVQNPASRGCSEGVPPLDTRSLRKGYDKWYLHRWLELGGVSAIPSNLGLISPLQHHLYILSVT